MNKEHFLIELKIYLKPLSNQQQLTILNRYDALFDEFMAEGETEEEIAKKLGKPRAIAEEVLQEFDIKVTEKKINRNDWQEFTPVTDETKNEGRNNYSTDDYYSDFDDPENQNPYEQHQRSHFARICQIIGVLSLNFLFMFWVILSAIMLFFSCWLVAVIFLFTPIIGAYSIFSGFNDFAAFQLFLSVFLSGLGIIGILILTPLTKGLMNGLRKYFHWTILVLKGDR